MRTTDQRALIDRSMASGIHLMHKPVGPTSFSLVKNCLETDLAHQRPSRRPPRICHGGTLDPFASGLLLILVEPATRLFDHLHAIPKVYEATVRWGVETDNGDPLGQPTLTGDASGLTAKQLDEARATFQGWHEQVPHATSAKRIGGERAYLKAQRGETVVMPPSRVYLHEAMWLGHDLPRESRLRLTVRGGFYVRALARDLGRLVGCGAHLRTLHRTAIGPWGDPGPAQTIAVKDDELLPWAHSRILSDQEVGDLRQDRTIPLGTLLAPRWQLPPGFPDPSAPICGFHLGQFAFLLTHEGSRLLKLSAL